MTRPDCEEQSFAPEGRCYGTDAFLDDGMESSSVAKAKPPRNLIPFRDVQHFFVTQLCSQALLESDPRPVLMVEVGIRKMLAASTPPCLGGDAWRRCLS